MLFGQILQLQDLKRELEEYNPPIEVSYHEFGNWNYEQENWERKKQQMLDRINYLLEDIGQTHISSFNAMHMMNLLRIPWTTQDSHEDLHAPPLHRICMPATDPKNPFVKREVIKTLESINDVVHINHTCCKRSIRATKKRLEAAREGRRLEEEKLALFSNGSSEKENGILNTPVPDPLLSQPPIESVSDTAASPTILEENNAHQDKEYERERKKEKEKEKDEKGAEKKRKLPWSFSGKLKRIKDADTGTESKEEIEFDILAGDPDQINHPKRNTRAIWSADNNVKASPPPVASPKPRKRVALRRKEEKQRAKEQARNESLRSPAVIACNDHLLGVRILKTWKNLLVNLSKSVLKQDGKKKGNNLHPLSITQGTGQKEGGDKPEDTGKQ